jgi:hypothetical protein
MPNIIKISHHLQAGYVLPLGHSITQPNPYHHPVDPEIKDDCQNVPGIDPSPIDVIVSGTVAERCHTGVSANLRHGFGRFILQNHWRDSSTAVTIEEKLSMGGTVLAR